MLALEVRQRCVGERIVCVLEASYLHLVFCCIAIARERGGSAEAMRVRAESLDGVVGGLARS